MQDGHPVAYAFRALNGTETNYTQIEKELLAVVLGMEKFETYMYRRGVTVESDLEPLEKSTCLLNAPKCLQRMCLRLQRYDLEIVYKRRTQMFLADALSRAYLPTEGTGEHDQEEVLVFCDVRSPTEIEAKHMKLLHYLPIKEETLQEIRAPTENDKERKLLADTIANRMVRQQGRNTSSNP